MSSTARARRLVDRSVRLRVLVAIEMRATSAARRTARNSSTTPTPVESSQCPLRLPGRSRSGILPRFHDSSPVPPRRRQGRSMSLRDGRFVSPITARLVSRHRVSGRSRRCASSSINSLADRGPLITARAAWTNPCKVRREIAFNRSRDRCLAAELAGRQGFKPDKVV